MPTAKTSPSKSQSNTKPNPYPEWQTKQFGRPTTYNPDYCELVIQQGIIGKGMLCQLAAHHGIAASTLNEYRDVNPEFANAVELARTYDQAYWVGLYNDSSLTKGKDMPQQYIQNRARNSWGWKDQKNDHVHSGKIELVSPAQLAWNEVKQIEQTKPDDDKVIEMESV